jgi:hypothetical protein
LIYNRILGEIQNFLGQSVVGRPHFMAAQASPDPNSIRSFPIAFYPLRTQRSYAWNGKIPRRRSGSLPLKSLNSPLLSHFSSKAFFISSLAIDPLNALSTTAAARMIPLLREAPPAKVASCVLVASTDLEKALDVAKEVIEGADAPSVTTGSQPAKSPNRPTTVGG